jgi:hypothetical protein
LGYLATVTGVPNFEEAGMQAVGGQRHRTMAVAVLLTVLTLGFTLAAGRADASPHFFCVGWASSADGVVKSGNQSVARPAVSLAKPVVGIAMHRSAFVDAFPTTATATGSFDPGFWLTSSDGGVFAQNGAPFLGSAASLPLKAPVVGITSHPNDDSYWLVAADGGVFTFGAARFFGSTGGLRLNKPIVGMAPTPSGNGYWLVAADGGIFTFGDAQFFGSASTLRLVAPIVAVGATATGRGYWLLGRDGGVFTFGDAFFAGSGTGSHSPALAMGPPSCDGYGFLRADGRAFSSDLDPRVTLLGRQDFLT